MRQAQAYLTSRLPFSGYRYPISLFTFKPLFAKANFADSIPNNGSSVGKKRILVVDDEKDIATMFRSGLERNGFSVDVFNDPLQALLNFKPGYYDLLLFDVRMPKMSGFELCREIRKQDKRAKVCFISAFEVHQEELKEYLSEENERCVVKKPVSTKDLVRIINEEIAGKT